MPKGVKLNQRIRQNGIRMSGKVVHLGSSLRGRV